MESRFVDCHSHVVPSGDDGAATLADGLELCDIAADAGTAVLFATPHVWPHLLLTQERERDVRLAHEHLRARVHLDLRLGYELTPSPALLREDPARYLLEGTEVVLMEVPFVGPADGLIELAETGRGREKPYRAVAKIFRVAPELLATVQATARQTMRDAVKSADPQRRTLHAEHRLDAACRSPCRRRDRCRPLQPKS